MSETEIKRGMKGECRTCPIALAMGRHVKATVMVSVGFAFGFWIGGLESGYLIEKTIPHEVSDWIQDFDNGIAMEPFTFETDIPAEAAA